MRTYYLPVLLLTRLMLYFAIAFLFWTLSLPLYVDLLAWAILLIVGALTPIVCLVITSVSMVISVGVVRLIVPLWFHDFQFYREHERYAQSGIYASNVNDVIDMPYGDLVAIDRQTPIGMAEPRRVHFKTDSRGFRNEREFNNQRFILVGDSFVVGNGTDEPDTLSGILQRTFGIEVYNVAYPSDPPDYYRRAQEFLRDISSDVQFAFFYYEGNDFIGSGNYVAETEYTLPPWVGETLNSYDKFRAEYLSRFPKLFSHCRWLSLLGRQVEREFVARERTSISVYNVEGKPMGFFDTASSFAMDPNIRLQPDMPENVATHTACAFFIPTKLRTYQGLLPPNVREKIPAEASALRSLRESLSAYNIPVIDLTPALSDAALKLVESKEYVFWRDDSHWNGNGMRAVAPIVVECLMRAGTRSRSNRLAIE